MAWLRAPAAESAYPAAAVVALPMFRLLIVGALVIGVCILLAARGPGPLAAEQIGGAGQCLLRDHAMISRVTAKD